jgi:hypothetical protein
MPMTTASLSALNRWSLLALLASSACSDGKKGEVIFPPEGLVLDSTGSQPRTYLPDSLVLTRTVGGASDQDTTLINPYLMTSDEHRVYLFETDNRVLCYDSAGTLLWVQGQNGDGPGEYRNPRDLKVGVDGRVWLVDPYTARVTRLNPETGKVESMIRMRLGQVEAVVPGQGRFMLYAVELPAELRYFTDKGDSLTSDSVPWIGFHQLEMLARQSRTAVDPRTGRWVLGFIYGNGWFAFDSTGRGSERRFYVEPTRFPAVIREYPAPGTISTSLVRSPGSALDMQLVGDTLFVLFDGQEPDRRRKVDLYSWESGKYLGSLRLPEPADMIAFYGASVRVFSTNPIPKLAYYRRVSPESTANHEGTKNTK